MPISTLLMHANNIVNMTEFHISSKNKLHFTKEELDMYYDGALDFWKEFCSNVHIYSPEGALLRKHLVNLPNDPRYRWAFYKA